jgi:hypothetical protein
MALILTTAGLAALANADATGTKEQATHLAVGDGNGEIPDFVEGVTSLVNEQWRGELQEIVLLEDGKTVEFVGHVPITVGGWYIREVAIYAGDTLLAIGGHPSMWKPGPEDSANKLEATIYTPVKIENATGVLELTVDSTKVLASQEHVATKIVEHDEDTAAHGNVGPAFANHMQDNAAHGGPYAAEDHGHLTEDVSDLLPDPHEWSEGQRYAQTSLPIVAGAVTWNMEANPVAVLPMTGNVTTFTMTNFKAGGTYELTTLQDASVVRSVIWPAAIRWPGGAAVELTQDANAEDLINFSVRDDGGTPILRGYAGQDFKAVV